jgi:hypothetical protein
MEACDIMRWNSTLIEKVNDGGQIIERQDCTVDAKLNER